MTLFLAMLTAFLPGWAYGPCVVPSIFDPPPPPPPCASGLVCQQQMCLPTCDEEEDCQVEGFKAECDRAGICHLLCVTAHECPEGADCSPAGYCRYPLT